jgi:hypothetical protein
MRTIIISAFLLSSVASQAADSLRVLFIGNSYTDVNSLPGAVSQLAAAGGDHMYYQMVAPGGYTFQQHAFYQPTIDAIAGGGWDYVVLQEQSQRPSFHDGQVANQVYPYARRLDSLVHAYNPCARTVFYMTWGRKNGDAGNCAAWPPVCTYSGMDSLLQLRYKIMADDNDAWLSPVAKVWRFLRNNNPGIELYQNDESHPSMAGTYAGALSFYSLFYHKNPELNSFNFSLSAATANAIKTAAKTIVYDSLTQYWNGNPPLIASYTYTHTGASYSFTNTAQGSVLGYEWDFGDGTPNAFTPNAQHTFAGNPPYNVCLTVRNQCDTSRYCSVIQGTTGIAGRGSEPGFKVYPNPFGSELHVEGIQVKTRFGLYSLLGNCIAQGNLTPSQSRLVFPSLPSGIYWLRLQAGEKEQVVKIVRQ